MLPCEIADSYRPIGFDRRKNRNPDGIPKKVGLGDEDHQGKIGLLVTALLAEVVLLYVLPEFLGHLGWGDLFSFPPTEYSGEMLV